MPNERFIFDKAKGPDAKHTGAGEEQGNDRLHHEDLYDQDEDGAGERVNLATGKPIDNSTDTGMEQLSVVDSADYLNAPDTDLKELEEAIKGNAAAEEWLRKNASKL